MDLAIDALLMRPGQQTDAAAEIASHVITVSSEVTRHLTEPSADSNDAMDRAAVALQVAAAKVTVPDVVRGLLEISQFYYVAGRAMAGVTPAAEAVRVARRLSEGELLRKALYVEGILLADTGNLPRALECYAEALDLSVATRDQRTEAKVWNNAGAALIYAAQYGDAIACFERAIPLGEGEGGLATIVEVAYSNIALAYLHLEDYGKGLRAAVQATEKASTPTSTSAIFSRVLSENYYTRLLLEVGAFDKARERCQISKQFAERSRLERVQLISAMAEGLYEVHTLECDVGLSRLHRVLEKARESSKATVRDALIANYKAHELAGKHDLAFMYLRELTLVTKRVQEETALFHHRLHLEQIEKKLSPRSVKDASVLLQRQELALRDKLARQIAEQELLRSRIEMLERLAVTAELRDDATGEHAYRVGRLASLLARDFGCDEQTCFMIDLAARLHDIGKIGIPDSILLTRRRLSVAERQLIQTHATVGAELLAQSNVAHLQMAEDIAKFHHECWDGSGYPSGLSGTAIPLSARITALADVFDALTHQRPYREAWPVDRALNEIARLKGVQFDPCLTELFLTLLRRLQTEVHDLDEYLAVAARQSPFLLARQRITSTLRMHQPERQAG